MNFFGHLKTITGHRNKVMVHCFKCGIPFQGLTHDLSKYTPVEFFTGCKYYIGTRSPNEGERAEKGYSLSWMHHKGRNKHHFEYWTDVSSATKRYEPVKMPYRYLVEMVCDRIAASKTYKGKAYTDASALEYFLNGYGRYQMHPETAKELEELLTMLRDRGEEETFAHIRKELKTRRHEC
jgi:hypothetical protein